MAKIAEVVKLYSGMSHTVNLKFEFYDKVKNKARMEGYKPIKSHRDIILTLVKAFQPGNTYKSSVLTGHYGTGKSHLLLMLANIFSQTPEQPELKTFFETFKEADPEVARQIKNIRGNGRYLVVIPDYTSTSDFNEVILNALEESLQKEDFDTEISTIYKEAVRYLDDIKKAEEEGSYLYSAFIDELEKEPVDYKGYQLFKAALLSNRKEALELFKLIYKRIIRNDFRYNASNINIILEDLIKSPEFTARFDGIVILYDEFDYALKNKRISVEVVQGLGELCRTSNKIIFIGAMHRQLSAYANEYSTDDFQVVQARFKPIDVRTEGLEELVSAIVKIDENEIYTTKVLPALPQLFSKLPDIKRLDLFKWLSDSDIQEKIIKAVYPLHPLSMSCLLNLSTAVGSSNRTLFTFLGGEGDGADNQYSYRSFINNNEILNSEQLLTLFTTDFLVDYFQRELDVNNVDLTPKSKDSVRAYGASYKELQNVNTDQTMFNPADLSLENTIYIKILKIMLVFDIVGIKCETKNIAFALNIQAKDLSKVTNALRLLSSKKVIFHNSIADSYEFRKGSEIDWSEFINIEREKLVSEGSFTLDEEFVSITDGFDPTFNNILEAKAFNSSFNSDFRLARVYELFKNFGKSKSLNGSPVGYFEYYERVLLNNIGNKDGHDGIVIFVIVESEDDVRKAREIAKENNSKYTLVVVPESPILISDSFNSLRAALNIKKSSDYISASPLDQARLDESFIGTINTGYIKQYADLRNKYLSGRMSTWFGQGGTIIENKPVSDQDPVKKFFKNLYTRFNNIQDEELNRKHRSLGGNKETIFKEAIDTLLLPGQVIKIDKRFGSDKGFIRYLQNVLHAKQILVTSPKPSPDSQILFCETQKDLKKYEAAFPALADMITEIQSNKSINLKKFLQKYKEAPYGLSNVTLKLFIAYTVKYFGDELEYKKTSTDAGEVQIKDFKTITAIVDSDNSLSVLNKRSLSDAEKAYLVEIYNIFSPVKLSVGDNPSLSETSNILSEWWSTLSKPAKSDDFFTDQKPKNFIQVINSISHNTFYDFFFSKTLSVSDIPEDTKLDSVLINQLITDIKDCKTQLDNILTRVENQILEKLLSTFNVEGNTDEDLRNKIMEWYNSLDENQREEAASWHTKESKALLQNLKNVSDITASIYQKLPVALDLGPVKDWVTNEIDSYINKVKLGIEILGKNKIKVLLPILETKDDTSVRTENKSEVLFKFEDKDKFVLLIKPPATGITVYLTDNNQDPQDTDSQKTPIKKEFEYKPKNAFQTLKLVSCDDAGNFSKVLTVKLKEKSEDRIADTTAGYDVDKPNDTEEAKQIIKALVGRFLSSDRVINKKDLGVFIKNLGSKLENEA
jgi:DNA replication protein DnaC